MSEYLRECASRKDWDGLMARGSDVDAGSEVEKNVPFRVPLSIYKWNIMIAALTTYGVLA